MEEENVPQIKYCTYCGNKIMPLMRSASENIIFYEKMGTMIYASKYNENTGQKQYCPYYKCSNYKDKKWYEFAGSPHDNYFINEIYLKRIDGVFVKLNTRSRSST